MHNICYRQGGVFVKRLGSVIAVFGILLCSYAVIGRFVGGATIGFGIVPITASAGLTLANSLMLIGIILKLIDK